MQGKPRFRAFGEGLALSVVRSRTSQWPNLGATNSRTTLLATSYTPSAAGGCPTSNTVVDDEERQALQAEGLDPDDPAVIAAIDVVRWELSLGT
jgi:hypothetical protein